MFAVHQPGRLLKVLREPPVFFLPRGASLQTAAVQIQFLPPQPDHPDLHYDRHSFETKPRIVTEKNSLSFQDAASMRIERHAVPRWKFVPEFAHNQAQLQRVLLVSAYRYCHSPKLAPAELTLKKLRKECEKKFARDMRTRKRRLSAMQKRIRDQHAFAVTRAGGLLQLKSNAAYFSWRCGWDSPAVAEKLGISRQGVRSILCRLVAIARRLGYPTFETRDYLRNRRKVRVSSCR